MPVKTEFAWNGAEILLRIRRALGRGLVGAGMAAVPEAKILAHRITGTMARSVHLADASHIGQDDEAAARQADIPSVTVPTPRGEIDWVLLFGSWVPYACVEEVGRGHQFVTPALDVARSGAESVMRQAFAEEGLLQ
jgi:hypothetical protein